MNTHRGTPAGSEGGKSADPTWSGSLFYFTHWGSMGAFDPFINVYLLGLGFSGSQIGLLATLLPMTTFVVGPIAAALADQYRWRIKLLRIALGIMVVSLLAIGLIGSTLFLTSALFVMAFSRAPVIAISDGVIARMAAEADRDYGRIRLWGSLSFAIVAIGIGWFASNMGFQTLFLIAGFLLLPAVFIVGSFSERPPEASVQTSFNLEFVRDRRLILILVASFLTGIAIGFSFIFDGILMGELGGNEFMIGLLFGVAALCELPTMHLGDRITRRLGANHTLTFAAGTLAASFLGYTLAGSPTTLIFFGALRGAGFGLFLVGSIRAVDALSPPEWAATSQSLRQAATFGLAPLLAGPLGGQIHDTFGTQTIFSAGIGVLACTLIVMFAYNKVAQRMAAAESEIIDPCAMAATNVATDTESA